MTQVIKESTLQFEHHNNVVKVCFSDSGNISTHICNILSGKEYPTLQCHFKPDLIVDIGANIGATALFLTGIYPDVDCFCYEPSLTNFTYLQRNTSFLNRIKIFNFGLSDESNTVKLYLGNSQCLQHSLYPSVEVSQSFELVEIRLASVELRDVLSGKRCLMKIDTEGCEVPILQNLGSYLENVDVLYVEYHSEQDRRKIDHLLSRQFSLCYSSASIIHRGTLMFLSQRLLSELPHLESIAIRKQ